MALDSQGRVTLTLMMLLIPTSCSAAGGGEAVGLTHPTRRAYAPRVAVCRCRGRTSLRRDKRSSGASGRRNEVVGKSEFQ